MAIHVHHWKIDSHNLGTCQLCGDIKQFVPSKTGNWANHPKYEWGSPFFTLVSPYAKVRPKE